MAIDVNVDLVVEAEVLGASSYVLDSESAHYNTVI